MKYFDLHHHHKNIQNGIYNVEIFGEVPDLQFSAGIHPKDILENNDDAFTWLQEISKNKNCFAIGECGLDGLIDVNNELQEEVFRRQIKLANELQKPIIIHCVKKHYELIPFKKLAKFPMIVHGFNKKKEVADALLKEEFLLSFGKAVLHNVSLQEILKNIAPEKYFLETDDADINIEILYKKCADIRGENVETIADQINKNLDLLING